MQNTTLGFISITFTILIWGTWLIFSRGQAKKLDNPFLENYFITLGALLFNVLVFGGYWIYIGGVALQPVYFIGPFIAGVLWALAGLFAMIACSKIGVGRAMAIWAPSGMIVSFLWGILYYKEFSGSLWFAVLAIATIIIGVSTVIKSREAKDEKHMVVSGALFALAASLIWGGTYLVPLKELSAEVSPFVTLLPLSVGMVVGASAIAWYKGALKQCSFYIMKQSSLIFLTGFMWAIGNFLALIAVLNLGIGKAYPLAELCGIVNALFAIFVLKEMTETKKIQIFFIGMVVAFVGAVWLSILKI